MKYFLTFILLFSFNTYLMSEAENQSNSDAEPSIEDQSDDDATIISLEDFSSDDLRPYLVWGVGIALLSSVSSDSGTGTATTD